MLIFSLAANKHGKCIKSFHWFPVHIHAGFPNLVSCVTEFLNLRKYILHNYHFKTKNRNKIKFGFRMYETLVSHKKNLEFLKTCNVKFYLPSFVPEVISCDDDFFSW